MQSVFKTAGNWFKQPVAKSTNTFDETAAPSASQASSNRDREEGDGIPEKKMFFGGSGKPKYADQLGSEHADVAKKLDKDDEILDNNLDDISKDLDVLRNIAMKMNESVAVQNQHIDHITNKVDSANAKTGNVMEKIRKV